MALNITTAEEVIKVDTICMTIYSQPGLGKTSLSFTASNPLLFDFDKGAHRAHGRKDTVQVSAWNDVANVTADDVAGYDTIVIDTIGKCLDALEAEIISSGSKYSYGGALNQQGWGQLKTKFTAFLKRLRSFGKDIIMIAHMDEQKDGDGIKERLKIQGGSKDLVCTDSDVMARISIVNRSRYLIFSPTEASFGKDPSSIGEMQVPLADAPEYPTFMEGVVTGIKDSLNELSEAQTARQAEVNWFKEVLPTICDADAINDLLGRAKQAGKDVSKLLVARAAELGLEYDNETKGYVYLEEMGDTPQEDDGEEQPADAA